MYRVINFELIDIYNILNERHAKTGHTIRTLNITKVAAVKIRKVTCKK
jgi:hypothetical protein